MRLFVYLLALLTGFSAAHASQVEISAPSAFDAAASIADSALADCETSECPLAVAEIGIKSSERELVQPDVKIPRARPATVYRGDRAHE